MCGIAGIVAKKSDMTAGLPDMVAQLAHRGPDAIGTYHNESKTVGLGHTRLSIIDLSEAANQPFFSSNGRYVIVFNGEVYNFPKLRAILEKEGVAFRTHSDTEVLVEAFAFWGNGMADKLEGMFALAIYDIEENRLTLFRDRLGKKPLYYFISPEVFLFASEIKSLIAHPAVGQRPKINYRAVSHFLHLGYVPEPDTIYESIHKFPAGCYAELDLELRLKTASYWSVKQAKFNFEIQDTAKAKSELTELLNNSVEKRLISDVPLGVFLSGGVDSSLVTAITAQKKQGSVKTFSIGFHESKFDESHYAQEVAAHFKTDHTKFILPEAQAANILETYLNHFDEPFADTSAIPTMMVSELARKDVKVVLTGDGGDELFMGYGAYAWADRLQNPFWKMARGTVEKVFTLSGKSKFQRVARLLDYNHEPCLRSHIFSQEQYFFQQTEIQSRLLRKKGLFHFFEYDETFLKDKGLSEGEKQAIFDLQYYLKDDLLTKVDRSSMYFALECRCPLLDDAVVSYALQLHRSLKIKGDRQKWILKEVLSDYLPSSLVNRRKWGFSIPLGKWLKNELNHLMNFVEEEQIRKVGLFNAEYVSDLINRFQNGEDYLYNRIWALIVMQRFLLKQGE